MIVSLKSNSHACSRPEHLFLSSNQSWQTVGSHSHSALGVGCQMQLSDPHASQTLFQKLTAFPPIDPERIGICLAKGQKQGTNLAIRPEES